MQMHHPHEGDGLALSCCVAEEQDPGGARGNPVSVGKEVQFTAVDEGEIMVWFKECRKCGGDLYLKDDMYGSYVSCLQCGGVAVDFGEKAPSEDFIEALDATIAEKQSA